MTWEKQALGLVGAFVVAAMLVGGVAIALLRTFQASAQVAAIVTLVLVAIFLVATGATGAKGARWLTNPYW